MEQANQQKYNFFYQGTNNKGILLVHGITGTPSEMHYLGKALNKAGFSVLCNTLPGHCSTLNELKKVTWQEIAQACATDLEVLCRSCQEVYVGGLSMGALMAMHLAYKFPQQVSGIVALAPTLFYDGWALPKAKCLMYIAWKIPFLRNRINIREGQPYGLKDETLRENIHRFYKNAKADEFDKKVLLFGSPFFPLASLYQHHLFTQLVKKELPAINSPILILHAQEDDMVSLKNAEYVMKNIASPRKSLVVLKDSYHMITIDLDKDLAAQEIIKFLNHPLER